jgi:hypothetical protein
VKSSLTHENGAQCVAVVMAVERILQVRVGWRIQCGLFLVLVLGVGVQHPSHIWLIIVEKEHDYLFMPSNISCRAECA